MNFQSSIFIEFILALLLFTSSAKELHALSSEELRTYELQVMQNITDLSQQILSIPKQQRNFDNTLGAWEELIEQISIDSRTDSNFQSFENLHVWIAAELSQNNDLLNALMSDAELTLRNDVSSPLQKHIATCFLENCENNDAQSQLFYLAGSFEINDAEYGDSTVLTFSKEPFEKPTSFFAEEILMSQTDIICVQDIVKINEFCELFDILKDNYAHFYLMTSVCGKEFFHSNPCIPSSTLIASKFLINNTDFNKIFDNQQLETDIISVIKNSIMSEEYAINDSRHKKNEGTNSRDIHRERTESRHGIDHYHDRSPDRDRKDLDRDKSDHDTFAKGPENRNHSKQGSPQNTNANVRDPDEKKSIEVTASAEKDSNGNSTAKGSITYSKTDQNDRGSHTHVTLTTTRDAKGKTSAKIEAGYKRKW